MGGILKSQKGLQDRKKNYLLNSLSVLTKVSCLERRDDICGPENYLCFFEFIFPPWLKEIDLANKLGKNHFFAKALAYWTNIIANKDSVTKLCVGLYINI